MHRDVRAPIGPLSPSIATLIGFAPETDTASAGSIQTASRAGKIRN